jgi:dTDP-4-amino-4,6-dideoxygalactose transaminase
MVEPFFSFSFAPQALKDSWQAAISEVIASGIFINGPQKEAFEFEFADYLGTEFAIGVSNGLDGLILALESCGIGPGKKVAVPNHTFIATWLAVHHVGATPVGIAVDKQGLMDLTDLNLKIDEIDAVIPVHMHGGHVNMVLLLEMIKNKKLVTIEDASQCHGGVLNGKKIGTFGDVGVFSLYPTKNLGALGDAGVVVTNSILIADQIREISSYGSTIEDKYTHNVLGRNARMDEIQASILRVNLKHLDNWNNHRVQIANEYKSAFLKHGVPFMSSDGSVFHHFIIFSNDRDALRDKLSKIGVTTEVYYPNPAYREYFDMVKCSSYNLEYNTEYLANNTIALPISQWVSLSSAKIIADLIVGNYE